MPSSSRLVTSSAPPTCHRPVAAEPRQDQARHRCRIHGGADGSGAPSGIKNGNYEHGRYTGEMVAARRSLREATCMLRKLNQCPERN
jgi:hypothetical protein